MIHQKSSQFQGLRSQSELEQLSKLRLEPKKDLSSVDEPATREGTGVRTESGTAALEEENEDPAASLFPVRARKSSPFMYAYKGLPAWRHPSLWLLMFKTFPGLPGEEAGV